ncbi:MAG: DUF58 domain-containing protein [Synechococcaceae cyanobacterium RL_1_2]|nr:DUF58 domain-containing protein [Synechococcaceae cyanobacterium RL_1_2]
MIRKSWKIWLEHHLANPSYGGWVLIGIGFCFFGAATNTMAGWLYVLSGIMFALVLISGIMARRSLKFLTLKRAAIAPVIAGNYIALEVELLNLSKVPQTLLKITDQLPLTLSKPRSKAIEQINSQQLEPWEEYIPTRRRGIYQWHGLQLSTASPWGLMWATRTFKLPAKAIVYPQDLKLAYCPLIDTIGREDSLKLTSDRRYQTSNEGLTKALRPYRYGDSTRLIHWRSSAKLGELQVRELETMTGGQDIVICLDSAQTWPAETFEQAVIAATSLYFYASKAQLKVRLWTAATDLIHGNYVVLETLAGVTMEEMPVHPDLPNLPLVWLTSNPAAIGSLPMGSRWLWFTPQDQGYQNNPLAPQYPGIIINDRDDLTQQLQQRPTF